MKSYRRQNGYATILSFAPELFPHQKKAVAFLAEKPRAALSVFLGGGKTRIVLEDLQARSAWPALVLLPRHVASSWIDETTKWFPSLTVLDLTRSNSRVLRTKRLMQPFDLALLTYEGVFHLGPQLIATGFAALICDEATKIKNHKTRAGQAVRSLADHIPIRRIMSGLLVPENLQEIWHPYHVLGTGVVPSTITGYRRQYFSKRRMPWTSTKGRPVYVFEPHPGAVEEIAKDVAPVTFSCRREDADMGEMAVSRTLLRCRLYPEAASAYSQTSTSTSNDLAQAMARVTAQLIVTGGHDHSDEIWKVLPCAKDDLLLTLFHEAAGERVVVWAKFKAELTRIAQLASKADRCSYILSGDTDARSVLQRFRVEPAVVLIAQADLASGMNFQDICSICVFWSRSFRTESRMQAEARFIRTGQRKPVSIYDLVASGTVDEEYYRALMKKKSLAEFVREQMHLATVVETGE